MLDTTQQPSTTQQPPITQHDFPSPREIASTLALTDGNVYLAAERLHLPSDSGPTDLLHAIGHDDTVFASLMRQLKAKAAIATYRDMLTLQEAIVEDHKLFEARDKIAAFNALAAIFSKVSEAIPQLTFNSTQNNTANQYNLNGMDEILRRLPADVRDAVKELAQTPSSNAPTPYLSLNSGTPYPPDLPDGDDLDATTFIPTANNDATADTLLPVRRDADVEDNAPTILPLRVPAYRKPRGHKSDDEDDNE